MAYTTPWTTETNVNWLVSGDFRQLGFPPAQPGDTRVKNNTDRARLIGRAVVCLKSNPFACAEHRTRRRGFCHDRTKCVVHLAAMLRLAPIGQADSSSRNHSQSRLEFGKTLFKPNPRGSGAIMVRRKSCPKLSEFCKSIFGDRHS